MALSTEKQATESRIARMARRIRSVGSEAAGGGVLAVMQAKLAAYRLPFKILSWRLSSRFSSAWFWHGSSRSTVGVGVASFIQSTKRSLGARFPGSATWTLGSSLSMKRCDIGETYHVIDAGLRLPFMHWRKWKKL